MPKPLTQEQVMELLDYNQATGGFRWRVPLPKARAVKSGDVAGTMHSSGYVQLCIGGSRYLAHRVAWLYVHGEWPHGHLDHVDRDKTNNSIANLRLASASENQRNRNTPKNNTTGVKGVHTKKRKDGKVKFIATIKPKGRYQVFLGSFDTLDEAKAARSAGAKALYGAFANEGD